MCEKLLCCFMLPVGTIALAGISTWQNPLISPHKTTSYIPQGYYSNSVTLISLYIVLLPLQSCLIYSAWLCISVQSLSRQNIHVWNTTECVSMPTLCTYLLHCRGKKTPSEQQYWMFFFFFPTPRIKPGGWWFPSRSLSFSSVHLSFCGSSKPSNGPVSKKARGTTGL